MRPETVDAVRRLVSAGGFQQTAKVIAEFRNELVTDEARHLLALQLTRHASHSRDYRVIAARLRALERSIAEGDAAAFGGYDAAAAAIEALVNAADWHKIRDTVESNRHYLFPEVADIAFADLVIQPITPDDESHILGCWTLIDQCRKIGVEAAIEKQMMPRRGFIPGPDVVDTLASAASPEELQGRLEAVPEIAARRARRDDGQAQISQWPGFLAYDAATKALSAPSDIRERIDVCRAALVSIDGDRLPIVWSMVALDLADALRKLAGYSSLSPMTEAIALYRDAIARLSPEGEFEQFAHAQQYLGDAYVLDSGGDQYENIEAAIQCYETALALRRPTVEPIPWAATAAHLGEALLRRAHGDPAIDVERAASLLEQAIAVLEKTTETGLLGMARLSFAAASIRRLTGSHDENLRRAASKLRDAIEGVQRSEYPDIWATANTLLGAIYVERASVDLADRESLLRKAEPLFRAAVACDGAGARVRARAGARLGWALGDQAGGDAAVVAEAISHQVAAIALYESLGGTFNNERGFVHRNLASLYSERASSEMAADIDTAAFHFRAALEAFPVDDYPVERRDTLRPMGTMYFERGRWADAVLCFDEAITISDDVLAGRSTELGKEAEVAENRGLYAPAAYCLVQMGRPDKALETIERGKVRMLAEALGWKESDDVSRSADDRQAFNWARTEIVRLEGESRHADASRDAEGYGRIGRRLRDAYRHLASLRSAEQVADAASHDLGAMLAEIPDGGALVVPIVTTRGSVVLVVPAGSGNVSAEHVLELESLTVRTLSHLLSGTGGSGGWLNAYLHSLAHADSGDEFSSALDDLAFALWDGLMGPIHIQLETMGAGDKASVVLMPSGWLGILPLHIARGVAGGDSVMFGAAHVVSYVPSLRVLRACNRRLESKERQGGTLLAVANPAGDLRFADEEVSAIAGLFKERGHGPDVAKVVGLETATRSNLLGLMAGRQYLHFACHAEFLWTNTAESGLLLAGDDRLRLADVLSPAMDLRSSRVVTLSACETGMTEFRTMPDEFIGLPGAFLEAGAPVVISSLWPVDDISTRFLMTEFYRLHLGGMAVAAALQSAQQWLREATADGLSLANEYKRMREASGDADAQALESWRYYEANPDVAPFAHPYYWAAFTATGAGG